MNGKKEIWAITLFIAMLMISLSAASAMQKQSDGISEINIKWIEKLDNPECFSLAQSFEPIQRKNVKALNTEPLFEGITPTVAGDTSNVCLGFRDSDVFDGTVWFTGSIDGGKTWTEDAIGYQVEDPEHPDVSSCGDGRFIGGMVPSPYDNDGASVYKWSISDLSDFSAEGYSLSYWTFNSLGFHDFLNVGVAGYTSGDSAEDSWAYGVTSMIGFRDGDGPRPLLSYQANEEGTGWIYFSFGAGYSGGGSTSVDIDPLTTYMYGVWNYHNSSSEKMDLIIRIKDFGTWEDNQGTPIHPWVGGFDLSTSGNDNSLDISARNDNIIIVSERDGKIISYVTSDGFSETLEEVVVSESGSKPKIAHFDDKSAACVFIDGGELYASITEDGGITWGQAVKQSGLEGAISGSISGNARITYEGTDGIIYYDELAVSYPVVQIGSISGGIGVNVDITNIGTGDAVDVPYTLSANGGILGMISKEVQGTVSIPAGGSTSISLPMIIGFGSIAVDVRVGSATKAVEGTQVLFFTML